MEEPLGVDNRPLCRATANPFQAGGFTSRSAGDVGALIGGVIEGAVDRPVVDQTGLTGNFEWQVTYALPSSRTALSSAPSIYTALTEQLGLKLEPRNYPLEMLVIDAVEMPSPN